MAEACKSIDLAWELGSPSIVTLMGGLLPGSNSLQETRHFALDCLFEIAEYANGSEYNSR
jgi:hypothetical protein